MKTLVIYDSLYGNTKTIAHAVGDALPGEVLVLPVGEVDSGDLTAVDLLVIGSPTHGALPTEAIRRLLDDMESPAQEHARAAAFDTRLTWFFLKRWGGFAAPKIAEALQSKGWALAGQAGGFFVKGLKGTSLKQGELERAAAWAAQLAAEVSA